MDRRNFLRSLVGGVAVGAAVRTWPFRVYGFPSEIILPSRIDVMDIKNWGRVFMQEMQLEKELVRSRYVYGIAYYQQIYPLAFDNLGRGAITKIVPIEELN